MAAAQAVEVRFGDGDVEKLRTETDCYMACATALSAWVAQLNRVCIIGGLEYGWLRYQARGRSGEAVIVLLAG